MNTSIPLPVFAVDALHPFSDVSEILPDTKRLERRMSRLLLSYLTHSLDLMVFIAIFEAYDVQSLIRVHRCKYVYLNDRSLILN